MQTCFCYQNLLRENPSRRTPKSSQASSRVALKIKAHLSGNSKPATAFTEGPKYKAGILIFRAPPQSATLLSALYCARLRISFSAVESLMSPIFFKTIASSHVNVCLSKHPCATLSGSKTGIQASNSLTPFPTNTSYKPSTVCKAERMQEGAGTYY